MKRLWQILGIMAYWLTVPGIWFVLRKTRRTRLLVSCGDQIVVVKPWLGNGKWCLPGGGLHRGESATKGVVREVYEEVGIVVDDKELINHGNQLYKQNGLQFSYQLFAIKFASLPKIKKQPIEIFEASWMAKRTLSSNNANQDVLTALRKSLK